MTLPAIPSFDIECDGYWSRVEFNRDTDVIVLISDTSMLYLEPEEARAMAECIIKVVDAMEARE